MALEEASKTAEESRRAALDALARAGTEGVAAYQQAQQSVRQGQEIAINSALRGAAARGAPGGANAELSAIISGPGDVAVQQLSAAQGRHSANNAADIGASENYFRQASAAVPSISAAAQREAAWRRQKAKEQAASSDDARWRQEALAAGLADIQAEAERTARAKFQPAAVTLESNPTYDPVGAALQLATGTGTPDQQALARQVIANPMAGATFRSESGEIVPVEPTAPSPHYMGRLAPPEARQLAEEIAGARVPDSVQQQRDAYTDIYGDGLESQALGRGIFRPPTSAQQVSQANADRALAYLDETGYPSLSAAAADQSAGERLSSSEQERRQASTAGFESVEELRQAKRSRSYAEAKQIAEDIVVGGYDLDELKSQLSTPELSRHPRVVRLILSEYAPRLVSSSYAELHAGG